MASTTPSRGVASLLIAVYAVLSLAAVGRSGYQIATKFDLAPLAYSLSAVAAGVYVLATVALVLAARPWARVLAFLSVSFEAIGVLLIGSISLAYPELFPQDTVWSEYGRGYVFIPLVLPFVGLWWLVWQGKKVRREAG
jgi:hypothetical protein